MEEQLREDFNAAIAKYQGINTNSWSLNKEKYSKIIKRLHLLASDKSIKKLHSDYRLLNRFRLATIVNDNEEPVEKLFLQDSSKQFIATEDIFDIVYETHIQSRHGGRCKMKKIIRQKYANITSKHIMMLRNLCPQCRNTCTKPKQTSKYAKPDMNDIGLYSAAHITLIDMRSYQDEEFQYVLFYQDQLTKFIKLRPLKTRLPQETSIQLVSIFSDIGAPLILGFDDGQEFAKLVLNELSRLWPYCRQISKEESQLHSEVKGHSSMKNIITLLTEGVSVFIVSIRWAVRIPYVQWQLNNQVHPDLGITPYEALFGRKPSFGLADGKSQEELSQTN